MKGKQLLNYIGNFVELTPEEESLLSSKVVYKKYLKNQYILQEGNISKAASFIISGCTKTFFIDNKGQEYIVVLAIEGWWIADIESFLRQKPSKYNVLCLEDTEVLQLNNNSIEELYKDIPKLERFWRIMMENAYIASQKRVLINLTLTAKERYLIFKKSYPKIESRIPQYLIASYLGITKEFLSKIKSQLNKQHKNIKLD